VVQRRGGDRDRKLHERGRVQILGGVLPALALWLSGGPGLLSGRGDADDG
jgi:hypothetical protein